MNPLHAAGENLQHAWEHLAEGWYALRQRAEHALAHFTPVGPTESPLAQNSARWGLLAAEVKEEADAIRVRLEIPGMDPEHFDIALAADNLLLIRGIKHAELEETSGRYYVLERAYGSFERALHLPAEVDLTAADAQYRHGVLSLTLPKRQRVEKRQIRVVFE